MKYATFLARGEPVWAEVSGLLDSAGRSFLRGLDHDGLERLAAGHRRVLSDLAYARGAFPGTEAEARLRRLAFAGHRALAGVEDPALPRLLAFYRWGYPAVFRQALGGSLRVAGALFLATTLLGFVIASVEPGFGLLFLGEDAVAGLRSGEIWTDSVGQVLPHGVLSTAIFTNNLSVALFAWASGAALGLGSLYALILNGTMFGAVLALCWRHELLDRLLAWVAAHGPLELSLIVVASAAGLELGWGALAWRNRPRAESFPIAARRSLLLVAGTLPWFVLLGLVEGYISPLMKIPTPLKALLGVALVGLFGAWTLTARPPDSVEPAR